ncbi:hypothetical protein RRG08_023347 [Elysia crispata]|uniref:Uncharacterized protein n=1 Tax=Elysia crispata TaxID=231223 RepID=A0AAE1BE54_9GAST|nr:hypothetical protein RRG08_023347 [Elysia crispata]
MARVEVLDVLVTVQPAKPRETHRESRQIRELLGESHDTRCVDLACVKQGLEETRLKYASIANLTQMADIAVLLDPASSILYLQLGRLFTTWQWGVRVEHVTSRTRAPYVRGIYHENS